MICLICGRKLSKKTGEPVKLEGGFRIAFVCSSTDLFGYSDCQKRIREGLKPDPDWRQESNGRPISIGTCRGVNCKRQVLWIQTKTGRDMPVDLESGKSHFETCPDAKRFKR